MYQFFLRSGLSVYPVTERICEQCEQRGISSTGVTAVRDLVHDYLSVRIEKRTCITQDIPHQVALAAQAVAVCRVDRVVVTMVVHGPYVKEAQPRLQLMLHIEILRLRIARIGKGRTMLCEVHGCIMRGGQAYIRECYRPVRMCALYLAHPVAGTDML